MAHAMDTRSSSACPSLAIRDARGGTYVSRLRAGPLGVGRGGGRVSGWGKGLGPFRAAAFGALFDERALPARFVARARLERALLSSPWPWCYLKPAARRPVILQGVPAED